MSQFVSNSSSLAGLLSGKSQRMWGSLRLAPEIIVFVLYFVAFEWIKRAALLPREAFEDPSLFLGFLSHLGARPKLAALLLPTVALLIWQRRSLWIGWADVPHGGAFRWILVAATIALAWPLSLGPYNYFVDQFHASDRLFILVFAVAAVRKPIMLLPLLVFCSPAIWEFQTYWGAYPWELFGLPWRLITLFSVWFVFSAVTKVWKPSTFTFLMVCLIAAHYWGPGLTKLRMGWFWENNIAYLFSGSHAIGWLAFLEPETVAKITRLLSSLNPLLIAGALMVEIGCLFIIIGRARATIVYLGLVAAFHLAIFATCGICLWQWAIVELVACIILWRKKVLRDSDIYSPWHTAFSFVLIVSAPIWLKGATLSWFDGPVKYSYRIHSVAQSGEEYELPAQFFAPYDRQLALNTLYFLSSGRPILTTGPRKDTELMLSAESLADLEHLEQEHGYTPIAGEALSHLQRFLQTFLHNYNRNPGRGSLLDAVSPPPGILTLPHRPAHPEGELINAVIVYEVLTHFDGQQYREMRTTEVLRMDIPLE